MVLGAALLWIGGCGGSATVDPLPIIPSAYAFCVPTDGPSALARAEECAAFSTAKEGALAVGKAEGERHVQDQTRGGYRLRSAFSLGLGGLAGLVLGTLLGAWVVTRLKRRRPIPHAQHLATQIAHEAEAVRKLGEPGQAPDDPVVVAAVQRLGLVVGEIERRSGTITAACERIEGGAADAAEQAHLQGLYARQDELLLLLTRVRIRVNLWIERRLAPDTDAVEGEVAAALAELAQAEAETPGLTGMHNPSERPEGDGEGDDDARDGSDA